TAWASQLSTCLVPASRYFEIGRGERRGWDRMFFPEDHRIEDEYLRPVLRSSRTIDGLVAEPDGIAFCCSHSVSELEHIGHTGALEWIKIFESAHNETGVALPVALARHGHHWYEMRDTTVADLVLTINPDKRLFVAKLRERSFVNQRLIRFSRRTASVDVELCHALMNSLLGVFYIEALGFGRGLGVLDLNATKVAEKLHVL